jgi:DNA polymerase III subunit delta
LPFKERREGSSTKTPSLYLLYGGDGAFKDETLDGLLKGLLPPESRDLNLETLHGSETTAEEILSRAETLPFLSSRRVIVLRDADHLSSKDREKVLDRLEKHPCPHASLIFLVQRIDRRESFFRSFQRTGKVISCDLTDPEAVRDWLQARARQRGKSLNLQAVKTLLETTGEDLNLLAGELEKTILFVGEREEIRAEDILAQTGWRTHHIFKLMEAFGYGRAGEVLEGIRSLLEHGEEPLRILGMISRHFRLFAQVKRLEAEGNPQSEMARQLKIPLPYLRSLLAGVPSLPWNALEGVFEGLLRSDSFLKSERTLGSLEMERLILDFCRQVGKLFPRETVSWEDQTGGSTF